MIDRLDVCILAAACPADEEDSAMVEAGQLLVEHLIAEHGLVAAPTRPIEVVSASFDRADAMGRMESLLAEAGVQPDQWADLVTMAKSAGKPMFVVAYVPTPPDSPHKALVN